MIILSTYIIWILYTSTLVCTNWWFIVMCAPNFPSIMEATWLYSSFISNTAGDENSTAPPMKSRLFRSQGAAPSVGGLSFCKAKHETGCNHLQFLFQKKTTWRLTEKWWKWLVLDGWPFCWRSSESQRDLRRRTRSRRPRLLRGMRWRRST